MSNKSLWVFGYGSLLWAPGFTFTGLQHGTVKGYARKFWQGNTTHRGTPSQPGRVATLIEDKESEVWGVAYEVADAQALPYLDDREVKLGGYKTAFTTFHPENGEEPFLALLYMATPDSSYWLGNAPESDIAENILSCSGSSGHNVEYLLRLAEFVRNRAPEVDDPHLFNLESIVRRRIEERRLPLDKLMGPPKSPPRPITREEREETDTLAPLNFVSTIQPKKLRCLTI